MKFNTYIVEMIHSENNFSGTVIINGKNIPATFLNISENIFTMHFKNQLPLRFHDRLKFKNKECVINVLLPALSKYNQRKLNKLAKNLSDPKFRLKTNVIPNLLSVEKILKVDKILYFLSIDHNDIIDTLMKLELNKEIKIIDFNELSIMSYSNYLEYIQELTDILNDLNTC
jgi:hypothetical protein